MRWMLLLLVLVACAPTPNVVMPLSPAPTVTPAAEKAPYLYYYSSEENAIVVERADSTDRFLLGKELTSHIYEAWWIEWSSSGKWVALQGIPDNSYRSKPIIAQVAGTRHWELDPVFTEQSQWSSSHDWLLIVSNDLSDTLSIEGLNIKVFDADLGSIIFERLIPDWHSIINWTPDGENLVIYRDFTNSEILTDEVQQLIGNFEIINLAGEIIMRHEVSGCVSLYSNTSSEMFLWHGDMLYCYNNNKFLIAENWHDGTQQQIPLPDQLAYIQKVVWNQDQTQALFLIELITGETQLYWFSWSDKQFRYVDPYSKYISHYFLEQGANLWTPDGNNILIELAENQKRWLYWLNLDDFSLQPTNLSFNESLNQVYIKWSGNHGFIAWNDNIWHYDPNKGQFTPLPFGKMGQFGRSPDGVYLIQQGNCENNPSDPYVAYGWCVYDWQQQKTTFLIPLHNRSFYAHNLFGEIRWHPYQTDYFLLSEDTFITEINSFWAVARINGIYRPLASVRFRFPTVNWLPDQVIPYLPQATGN